MNKETKIMGLAALAAIAVATPVLAEPIDVEAKRISSEFRTAYVHYDDLDLTTARGEHRLNDRVQLAVRTVCPSGYVPPMQRGSAAKCRTESWERAEPQIALAVTRARQIAMIGKSEIPPVVIAINLVN